ncbi:MAG: EamA family transporter, partial [Chitinophagia bacterium]|nr:EamA family transporter [Chitinophagia bacterium]
VILILTWGIVLFRGGLPGLVNISRNNLTFLVLSGLATGLSWLFYYKALQIGEVHRVAPLDKLSIAITMVLAWLILKEHVTVKDAVGGALIVAGA